ncbi:MAG TPA: glycosyltransferase [Candidatus Krumholzibacteria bacterium]
MEKRRIALVASTFGVGGAEMLTANVLRRLSRERHDVRLYFLHGAGAIGRELLDAGFEGIEHLCRRRRDPAGALRLANDFRSFRPRVMWALDHMDAMWMGRVAALAAGVPAAVVSSHSTGLIDAQGRIGPSFRRRERILMEFVTRLVAVSRTHAEYLRRVTGIAGERVAVIHNGIDLSRWPRTTPVLRRDARQSLGIREDEAVVAMVAAMRPEKSHESLLAAAAMPDASRRRVRVLLAGDGPRRGAIEAAADELGIRDRVDFLGVRRDVARLLHASDVVVLPSRSVVETLPLSLLEAMACGVPVIASRVGSVPELIEDGVTGRLVTPGDVAELARCIATTLDDGPGAGRMADEARRRVEAGYSIEHTTEGYQRLFDEVLAA